MTESTDIVKLDHLSFAYGKGPSHALVLDDICLNIHQEDFLGIIGPNGGGKTTLLKVILGLLEPQTGEIRVFAKPPARVRNRIGYVPQHARIDTTVPASALDVVLMGRLAKSRWGPIFSRRDKDAAMAALSDTGTADLAKKPLGKLSGGQRQRVLIARALAGGAELLLLDEPTVGVDIHAEKHLLELLHRFNQRMPIVMVSHDIAFVSAHFKRVACLNRTLSCHKASEISGDVITDMYRGELRAFDHDHSCPIHGDHVHGDAAESLEIKSGEKTGPHGSGS